LPRAPNIPLLREDNVRQGFFERPQFEAVRGRLAPELRGLVTVAYITGWRVPSELQPLQWRQVDFKAGTLRLEPGTTNKDGRTFIMTAELRDVLEAHYRRYAVVDEQSLREAAVKLDAASDPATMGKVLGKVAPADRPGVS
jgi:integrase